MITLRFAAPALKDLGRALEHPRLESAAILLATPVDLGLGEWRLLVREVHVAQDADYVERSPVSVTLKTEFCLPFEKRAKIEGLSLIYCHTHPGSVEPRFSDIDDEAEAGLRTYLAGRGANAPHAALLFSSHKWVARRLGESEPVRVIEIGSEITAAADLASGWSGTEAHDRQILAFGAEGQARIAQMRVGIVGLGGTGSAVLQQLAHLGVRRFLLIDNDHVEASNLNRLIGAVPGDAGVATKVAVAERAVRRLAEDAEILGLKADVTAAGVGERLAATDLIFSCTDTHASRHLLNQFAYQYYVPVIDMGVAITVSATNVQMSGHVKMVAPGLPCLWCVNHLDPAQVRAELMTDAQRAADPYFQGGPGVAQPAVISLNSTVASLAVTMFLSAVTGIPSPPRYVLYDGNRARSNALEAEANPGCPFCGPDSPTGLAGRAPLPARQ